MSHSLACAKVTDWLLELIPVWEVPVTAVMIHNADPTKSRPVVAQALKQLVEADVLYVEQGDKDRMFYFPTSKRPVCLIQALILGRSLV